MDWLFDSGAFMPRSQCGNWSEELTTVYQVANLCTALAYYMIPPALLWLYKKKASVLPRPEILLWFSGFIFLCGTTHVLDFLAFYWPAYRLFTLIEVLTAVVSLATACMLPSTVFHFAQLKTPAELEIMAQRAESAKARAERSSQTQRRINSELKRQVDALDDEIRHLDWRHDVDTQVAQLREKLKILREVAS